MKPDIGSDTDARAAVDALRRLALPLREEDDHRALLELVGDATFVLLGEASHGTHEFYAERARITRRLICWRTVVMSPSVGGAPARKRGVCPSLVRSR